MTCSSCTTIEGAFPRISARSGKVVDLDVSFYNNGVPTDPYAVRYVEIYKTSVAPHNLVATIPFLDPDDELYPSPAQIETLGSDVVAGRYHLPFSVPADFTVPDVYYDLWYYLPTYPCSEETDITTTGGCNLDDYEDQLLKCCHRFWIYPDEWFCGDCLQTIRFGFEPLDQRFHKPEVRPLEVGLMPLPLYDYNASLVNPIIPFLRPTITIETNKCEILVQDADACIGIRQGSYRTNPWVVRYTLDTSGFLKGTYKYQITLNLPNGESRVSQSFNFSIF